MGCSLGSLLRVILEAELFGHNELASPLWKDPGTVMKKLAVAAVLALGFGLTFLVQALAAPSVAQFPTSGQLQQQATSAEPGVGVSRLVTERVGE